MKYQVLDRDGQAIPSRTPDSPDIIQPPQPTITEEDQRPAPSETNAISISNHRGVENSPTFSTVVGAPPTDTPNPASPPPIEIPEAPVQPGQQLQLPRNDHFEALFTDDNHLRLIAEELGLTELSRDLDDEDLIIRAANNALVDHVWPVEPASSPATIDLRRDTLYQQLTGTTPANHREFFNGLKRQTLERQALREQRFPTWLEQQDVRAIPELDIKAMYIRMGHHYAEEAAERRNRPFARPSDSEAEALGRKIRRMQQQEMTDINPERKPDSAADYIWDTGKLILGGTVDGSVATLQGIPTLTAAALRKYGPDKENTKASIRSGENLSRDLGQLRQAYANTYKVDPVYADHVVGKVATFVGQTLPYVASYALGAPGVIFTTFFQNFQNNWDDAEESARRNGVIFDPDRAFNYAITVSTADAVLSVLPVGRVAGPWLKGSGASTIQKNFLELFKKTASEGTVSAVQGGVKDAAASHYKIDDRNPFDLQNRTFDFVVGGGTAAPFTFNLTPQHPPTLRLDAENSPPRPPNGSPPPNPPPPASASPQIPSTAKDPISEKQLSSDSHSSVNPYRHPNGDLIVPNSGRGDDPALKPYSEKLRTIANDQQLADQIYDQIPDAKGGKVIGTDIARELLEEYAVSREGKIEFVNATGDVAHFYAKDRLWREINNRGERKTLLFTAGGVAAGKSSALNDKSISSFDLVFDGTLRDSEWAIETMSLAISKGWKINISYVQRPIELVIPGAIYRAQSTGRWGPIADLPNIHVTAQQSIIEIAKAFQTNPNVHTTLWLNDGLTRDIPPNKLTLEEIDIGGKHSYIENYGLDKERDRENRRGLYRGMAGGGGQISGRASRAAEAFRREIEKGVYDKKVLRLLVKGNVDYVRILEDFLNPKGTGPQNQPPNHQND